MSQPVCRCDDPMHYNCGELRQWWEEAKRERDEARAECDALRERQAMVRAFDRGRDERCASCGRPTYAGEDFDGPCVHDTDLECALARVKEEAERVTAALDERNVARSERDEARSERDEARAEVERLRGLVASIHGAP